MPDETQGAGDQQPDDDLDQAAIDALLRPPEADDEEAAEEAEADQAETAAEPEGDQAVGEPVPVIGEQPAEEAAPAEEPDQDAAEPAIGEARPAEPEPAPALAAPPAESAEEADEDLFGDEKKSRWVAAEKHEKPRSRLDTGGRTAEVTTRTVGDLDLLSEVSVSVTAEIGRTEMTIEDILKLGPGSLIELDKLAGEPVELYVNDRCVARGEVVVVDDNFGVRITELGA